MGAKMEFSGDAAKLSAELARVLKSEKELISAVQQLTKESEKSERAAIKEAEARGKAVEAAKNAKEEATKLARENEKHAKEVDKLNAKLEKQKKTQDVTFESGIASLRSFALGYVGFGAAINVVTAAMERQRQVGEKAMSTAERNARWQSQIIMNNPGQNPEYYAKLFGKIEAGFVKSGGSNRTAFGETVASTGAAAMGDMDRAIAASIAASRLTQLTPEETRAYSAASVSIGKGTGDFDPERNLGFLLQLGQVTRQARTQDFAQTLPKALAAGASTSSNRAEGVETAAEVYATLSNAVEDEEGRITSQATLSLLPQLADFFQKQGNDPGTHAERIRMLQQDAALRQKFLGGLEVERVFRVPIREMLTPGSREANDFAQAQAVIDYASAEAMYDPTAQALQSATPEIEAASAMAEHAGRIEGAMMAPGLSSREQVRKMMTETLSVAGDNTVGQQFGNYLSETAFDWKTAFGSDPFAAGDVALAVRQGDIQTQAEMRGSPLTADEQRVIAILQDTRDEIRRLRESQERFATPAIPNRDGSQ